MDEFTQSRIFEPFFSTKGPGKGTGLGLAVVYSIVNSHEGLIRVESKIGVGTSFYLYFPIPAELPAQQSADADLTERIEGHREQILIVEDETMVRDLMKGALERNNYNVLSAVDGIEAIEHFNNHSADIDLVVMDIGLPKLSGWEAYKKIYAQKPATKVIFISGYVDPELKDEIINKGKHTFLQKPFSPFMLLRHIRMLLDTEKHITLSSQSPQTQ